MSPLSILGDDPIPFRGCHDVGEGWVVGVVVEGGLGVLELYTVCEAIFPGSKVTRHKAALKRPNVIDAEENSIRGSYDSSLSTQQQQHATVNTHQQLQHLQHLYSVYSSAATASSTSLQCILNFCIFNIPKRNSHQPLPSASLSKQSHLYCS